MDINNAFHKFQMNQNPIGELNNAHLDSIEEDRIEKEKKETLRFRISVWVPVLSGFVGVLLGGYLTYMLENTPQITSKEKELLLEISSKLDSVLSVNNRTLQQKDAIGLPKDTTKDKGN